MHKLNRFPKVAELTSVCWLEICGRINTCILSLATLYTAYLEFKTTTASYGYEFQPIEAVLGLVGGEIHKQSVCLDAERGQRLRFQILPMQVGLFNSSHSSIMGFHTPQPKHRENEELDGLKYPKEKVDGY